MGVMNPGAGAVPDKQLPQPEQKQHDDTAASLQAWGSPAGKIQMGSAEGSPAFSGGVNQAVGAGASESTSLDDMGLAAWNASNAGDLSVGARDFVPRWGSSSNSNSSVAMVSPEKGPPIQGHFPGTAPGARALGALGSIAVPDSADGFNEDDMNAKFSSLLFDD